MGPYKSLIYRGFFFGRRSLFEMRPFCDLLLFPPQFRPLLALLLSMPLAYQASCGFVDWTEAFKSLLGTNNYRHNFVRNLLMSAI